jgi:hypothetical protein
MENKISSSNRSIMWTARIISLIMIALTLFFAIAEGITEQKPYAAPTPVINIVAGVLMLGGLALAWKWELYGSLISLVGFVGVLIVNPSVITAPAMYLFAVPAILFLGYWWLNRTKR